MKKTGRDPRVLPKTVLYDPTLTVTMPPMLSATSGMNSIAHCVEALYSKDANPIISMIAEEGIRALAAGLPVVVKEPANLDARSNALYGAWLGGVSLGAVGMALHHKLCHTLGGSFNLAARRDAYRSSSRTPPPIPRRLLPMPCPASHERWERRPPRKGFTI